MAKTLKLVEYCFNVLVVEKAVTVTVTFEPTNVRSEVGLTTTVTKVLVFPLPLLVV